MASNVFCPSCGTTIANQSTNCKCGYNIPENVRAEISRLVKKTNSIQLFNKNWESRTREAYNKLKDYKLDPKYYRSSTAKKDFDKKNIFIKEELIPKVTLWREKIIEIEKIIAKEKLEVHGRIYQITDFIINDFFGKFKLQDSEHNIKVFLEMRDFSKYEIAETISTSDLDNSDIEITDLGVIGSNIFSSGFSALENGSFVELAEKSEWSKSDQNRVAAEVGIAVGMEIINGISKIITQNSQAIRRIRESNLELDIEMEKLLSVICGLSIEEKTLKKYKRKYDSCDLTLDFTYKYKLLPVINKLIENPTFIEYKNKRRPYDLEQEKIQINETVLKEKINLSFWGSLLKGKKANFKSSWEKRIKLTELEDKYKKINLELNESLDSNLSQLFNYKIVKNETFKEFEKKERKVLKQESVWRDNCNDVIEYATVFKNIRKNLN